MTGSEAAMLEGEAALNRALFSYAARRVAELGPGDRFVHYTAASTALSIIKGDETGYRSMWLHPANSMNDFSEIEWGQHCLTETLKDVLLAERLQRVLDTFEGGMTDRLFTEMAAERQSIASETYLLSLSLHDRIHARTGLLSMWRAYGGSPNVCMVFNTQPFITQQFAYELTLSPVMYGGPAEFHSHFEEIVFCLEREALGMRILPPIVVRENVKRALGFAVNSTKHPGFSEEREWRVIFHKGGYRSAPPKRIIIKGGAEQTIYEVPFTSIPEKHVYGAEISHAVDRVVIGPAAKPFHLVSQFIEAMSNANFTLPEQRASWCEIPLRT